jgi:hypothetical protein
MKKTMNNVIEYKWSTGISKVNLFIQYILGIGLFFVIWHYDMNFALIFVVLIIAFVVLYSSIAHTINRTKIELTPTTINVNHMPLPWIGDKIVELTEIRNFYHLHVWTGNYDRNSLGYIDPENRNISMFSAVQINNPKSALECLNKLILLLLQYSKYEIKELKL